MSIINIKDMPIRMEKTVAFKDFIETSLEVLESIGFNLSAGPFAQDLEAVKAIADDIELIEGIYPHFVVKTDKDNIVTIMIVSDEDLGDINKIDIMNQETLDIYASEYAYHHDMSIEEVKDMPIFDFVNYKGVMLDIFGSLEDVSKEIV